MTQILWPVTFLIAVILTSILKKTARRMNGILNIIYSYFAVMCMGVCGILIVNAFTKRFTPELMTAVMAVIDVILLVAVIRGERQKQSWNLGLVIGAIVCVAFVVIVSLQIFGLNININYPNQVDSGVHYAHAITQLRYNVLMHMCFTPLYNAMFIQEFAGLLPATESYKLFILSDIFHQILQLLLVYGIFWRKIQNKLKCVLLVLLYWVGWPLYGFLMGFIYWVMAGTLILFLVISMKMYEEEGSKWSIIAVILAVCGIGNCYVQFLPGVCLSIVAYLAYRFWKKQGRISRKQWIVIGVVCSLVAIAGIVFYQIIFVKGNVDLFAALRDGAALIQGMDTLVLLPIALYPALWKINHKKTLSIWDIFLSAHVVMQLAFVILVRVGIMSTYYMQKSFLVLWGLSVLAILHGEKFWDERRKKWRRTYFICAILFLFLGYNEYDNGMFSLNNSVYCKNLDSFVEDTFADNYMSSDSCVELFEAAEQVGIENDIIVPIICDHERKGVINWYAGMITKGDGVRGDWSKEGIQEYIAVNDIQYFVILYNDKIYTGDRVEYLNTFERVFENGYGFVAKVK